MNSHFLATLISYDKLKKLKEVYNVEFIGESSINIEGNYKKYWKVNDAYYYTNEHHSK